MRPLRSKLARAATLAALVAGLPGCGPESTGAAPGGRGADGNEDTAADARGGGADTLRPVAAPADGRHRRALVIAIQDYQPRADGRYGPLSGTRNDAELFAALLTARFGFPAEDVRTLFDRDATLDGIVAAFREHLLARARRGDEVVVYYAGHGSRVPDRSGLETDELDSTFVAWDSRRDGRDGEADLTDDAVHTLVRDLIERTGCQVTVVTDSCHSGGAMRGDDDAMTARVRALPDGHVAGSPATCPSWPADLALIDDDERARRGEFDRAHGYVHLAACGPRQEARETSVDGVAHGLFTWSLVRALEEAHPGETWRTALERTAAVLRQHPAGRGQIPHIDGEADRLVFGAGFGEPLAGHRVEVRFGDRVDVRAGSAQGVVEGVVLAVRTLDGADVGRVEILRAGLGESLGRWVERPERSLDGLALRGRIVDRPAALPRLAVHVRDAALAACLRDHAWARAEPDRDTADYELVAVTGEPGQVALRTTLGIELWRGPRPTDPGDRAHLATLGDALRRETQWRGLWDLAESGARGKLGDLRVRFEAPEPAFLAALERDADARSARGETALRFDGIAPERVADAPGGRLYQITVPTAAKQRERGRGVLTELVVDNETLESVHLHVIALTETRGIVLLWPTAEDEQVAGDGRQPLRVGVHLSSDRAGFPLDRPMRERYLVLATAKPIPLDFFHERVADARGPDDAMPGPLAAALDRSRERRTGTIADAPGGWGLAFVDLLVSEAD
ncbi:MAG: caspase family protein [Planctomycetes bacterium]|nr:caspase family protein [Planctomycetota bacterium]